MNELEEGMDVELYDGGLTFYDLSWFDICLGKIKMDSTFESLINKRIESLGIIINEKNISNKIDEILKDKKTKNILKDAIKSRITNCSNKPLSTYDKVFRTMSFPSLKECDKKDKGSILYLYDEYYPLMDGKANTLTKVDMALVLIYCETRQHLLSKYISLEIIRRKKSKTNKIVKILDKIYKIEGNDVLKHDKELEIRKKNEQNQEDIEGEKRKKEKLNRELIVDNEIDLDMINNIKDGLELDNPNNKTRNFIDNIKNELYENKNEDIYSGGSDNFDFNKDVIHKQCDRLKKNKNIYLDQLQYINDCLN